MMGQPKFCRVDGAEVASLNQATKGMALKLLTVVEKHRLEVLA